MLNKPEKQVIKFQLDKEQAAINDLERQYKRALRDIEDRIKMLQADELTQSRIYQIQSQKALKGQVEAILDKLQGDEYATIQQYLHDSYQDGYIGTMYSLHGQGIPLILPIDQNAAVKAVITDSQIQEGLYNHLGVNIKQLKQAIRQEITRGLAANMPFADIARNIANRSKAPLSRAKTIVRTEGHRIQQASANDARETAKANGCDVVKQWDGTLDGDTRPTHRRLDGQIRETDKPFEMDGKTAMFPGDFGKPEEDCNCRCVALTRAKWALDEDELKVLKDRAKFFEVDKKDDFKTFEEKYLKAETEIRQEREQTKPETAAVGKKETQRQRDKEDQQGNERENKRGNDALVATYKKRLEETGAQLLSPDEYEKLNLVDYGTADPRAAAAANKVLDKYKGKYNSWIGTVNTSNDMPMGAGGYTEISAIGGTGNVTLNSKMLMDYDRMVDIIRENGLSGHGVRVKPEYYDQYIMTHEYGHTLLQQAMTEKSAVGIDHTVYRKAMKEARKVYADYLNELHDLSNRVISLRNEEIKLNDMFMDDDADVFELMERGKKITAELAEAEEALATVTISRYANIDIDEFIAEAWTEREIGENPGKYSQEIGNIIDKYFAY